MNEDSNNLCKIPKVIEFQYYPEQQMHSHLQIINLIDAIVKFKIKTNQASYYQYLVRPMQGQIYNRELTKIKFIRKQLSLDQFKSYFKNPSAQSKEQFKIYLEVTQQDLIGRQKIIQQIQTVSAHFYAPKTKSIPFVAQNKIQPKQNDQQLQNLKQQLKKLQSKKKVILNVAQNKKISNFKQNQLILLMIWAFIFGLVIW